MVLCVGWVVDGVVYSSTYGDGVVVVLYSSTNGEGVEVMALWFEGVFSYKGGGVDGGAGLLGGDGRSVYGVSEV